jgi:hypothetical protein
MLFEGDTMIHRDPEPIKWMNRPPTTGTRQGSAGFPVPSQLRDALLLCGSVRPVLCDNSRLFGSLDLEQLSTT